MNNIIVSLGFEKSRDLYFKLKHDYKALKSKESGNNYMNFILCAFHLSEWLDGDSSLSGETKDMAKALLEENNIELFKDIANGRKHYILTINGKVITKDEFISEFNYNMFDYSKINFGKPLFKVVQDDKEIGLFEECEKIYNVYKDIFEKDDNFKKLKAR
ncbi:hypothetical protein [Clostridium magnum]|uniref:Uncharacterized protein n=1 Tax=Clostridium magnum DSM 2767 TaxID=1121326 RepID=A0A162SV23_9CLOT|nr:hypothetical protein [Clostridium magnum]KZL91909.1 hypothetical protein CLMAG_17150 [Clostridium magnum DSM 2767]SHH30218.1 hypothetical protein SAMN02745944_00516 [Clostridium magnum DSM 2767]